jgi:hypothetical protein
VVCVMWQYKMGVRPNLQLFAEDQKTAGEVVRWVENSLVSAVITS